MDRKERMVGIIGVGIGAKVHAPAFQSEGFNVVAICSRKADRAAAVAHDMDIPHWFSDYRQMLAMPEIDAVSIATPPYLHHQMVLDALNSGKHVLCEKPFAMNSEQAREMLEMAERTGLTAMVCHQYRYSPTRAYIKDLLSKEWIGDFLIAQVSLFVDHQMPGGLPLQGWKTDSCQGAGWLGSVGSHYIDCFRDWFGDYAFVSGVSEKLLSPSLRLDIGEPLERRVDDTFGFVCTFRGGGQGSVVASSVVPFGSGAQIVIYGTEGLLFCHQLGMNPVGDDKISGARRGKDKERTELPIPRRFYPFDDPRDDRLMAFRLLVRRFATGLDQRTSPSPNFVDGLRCQEAMDFIINSSSRSEWLGQETS